MDVVAVGDVALVRDALDHAEPALQALGELVGGGLQRCAVQGIVDILRSLPLGALVVHPLHDLQGEGGGGGIGMALASHVLDALIQPRIAQGDGRIAVIEQLVDDLALLQPGQGTVLPKDRGHIGGGALQTVMPAAQGTVAQLQPLVKDLPEPVQIAAGGEGYVRQVDGDHALIEAAVVLVLARLVVSGVGDIADPGVGKPVRRKEGAAAHAGVYIALELQHFLLADIVGHHAPGGTLGGQLGQVPVRAVLMDVVLLQHIDKLGEGGGDPHAVLVLHTLIALEQRLLDDESQILLLPLTAGFVEVHIHGDEGGLSVGGQQGDHLVLDGLHAPADLLPQPVLHDLVDLFLRGPGADGLHLRQDDAAQLLTAHIHERGQVGQGDGLAAVLVTGHLSDDLGGDVAGGGEAVGTLDQRTGDDGAVLQHVLQIHQVAVVHVLGKVVGVVEVDDALPVCLHDVGGQQDALAQVAAHLAGHVVPLGGVDHGVLVGVFLLGLFVAALDQTEDLIIGRVAFAYQRAGIAVGDIVFGHLKGAVGHDLVLHQVLNLLHGGGAVHFLAGELDRLGDALDLDRRHTGTFVHRVVGLSDGGDDLRNVKTNLRAVSFDNDHDDSYFLSI